MSGKGLPVHIDVNFGAVARLHMRELSFLEVGGDPNVIQGNKKEKTLARLDDFANFDGLVCDCAVLGRNDRSVVQVELSGIEAGLRLLDGGPC